MLEEQRAAQVREEEERRVKRELEAKARKLEKEKRDAEIAEKKAMIEADREKMLRRNQNRNAEDIINLAGVRPEPAKQPEPQMPAPAVTPVPLAFTPTTASIPINAPESTISPTPSVAATLNPAAGTQPKKQVIVVNPAVPFLRKQSAPALLSPIDEASVLQTYNTPFQPNTSSELEYNDRTRRTSIDSLTSARKRLSGID